MYVLIINGSRSTTGQTASATTALTQGLENKGATVEQIFLPTLNLERCRQCEDNGWGICRTEGRCVIEDQFADIVAKIGRADGVVFATPVYFSDLSESLRAFTDRLRRTCFNEAGRVIVTGKPAMGVCVAGGGGRGAPPCCVSLDQVLTTCGFDVVDLIPVRRQNLEAKLPALELAGRWFADAPTAALTT